MMSRVTFTMAGGSVSGFVTSPTKIPSASVQAPQFRIDAALDAFMTRALTSNPADFSFA